jgi:hypothetical protein
MSASLTQNSSQKKKITMIWLPIKVPSAPTISFRFGMFHLFWSTFCQQSRILLTNLDIRVGLFVIFYTIKKHQQGNFLLLKMQCQEKNSP